MDTTKTFNLNTKGKDGSRHELIRIVCESYFRRCPREARMVARYLREITSQEIRDGKWSDGNTYVKIRFPSNLFHCLRSAFGHANMFPNFGDTEEDIRYLVREYPDMFKQRRKKPTGLFLPKK
jgi:hypothetical protein